jgi:ribosomal protein S18 acetylase RimI-like enzyme
VRDLYAAAAARWVEEGRRRHYALVPAHDPGLVAAWFRVGFGQQQAHAVQETGPREVAIPDGYEIGPPNADDVERLIPFDLALPSHQGSSPVFSDRQLPTEDESRREWAETLANDEEQVWIGYRAGQPVACWSVVPAELSSQHAGLGRPQHSSYLGFAVTLPEARGSGIGTAITDTALTWAADQGYESMIIDWRVTNLLASRFWPKRGFRETFLRLYRSIP